MHRSLFVVPLLGMAIAPPGEALALPSTDAPSGAQASPSSGSPATLPSPPGLAGPWGLHNGDTVGARQTLISGEVGWPDLSLGLQRGVNSRFDVGVRVSWLYGLDYSFPIGARRFNLPINVGFGIVFPLRVTLVRTDRLSWMVHLDPGIKFDSFQPTAFWGPQLPVGMDLGVHFSERSTLAVGVDMPFLIRVAPEVTGFTIVLGGLSYEHHLTDRFGMVVNVRSGVVHGVNKTGSDAGLGFLGQVGFFGRL